MLGIRKAITQPVSDEVQSLKRQIEAEARSHKEAVDLLRRQMARIAAGYPLSAEALDQGRLYNDIPSQRLTAFVEEEEAVVLDVRSPAEWASGHIPGSRHIPIDQLARRLEELQEVKGETLVAVCAAGARSAAACELLSQNGFSSVFNAAGGIGAWSGPLSK